jgi:hypothetical protein
LKARNSLSSTDPTVPYLAEALPLQHPSDGRVAQVLGGGALQKAAPLQDSGSRAFFHILFKEFIRALVDLWMSARALGGNERIPSMRQPDGAPYKGEDHVEKASCRSLRDT